MAFTAEGMGPAAKGIGPAARSAAGRRWLAAAVLAAPAVLAAARPAAAATAAWRAIGPSGGGAQVTIDPTAPATLYATAGDRIWKTVDGGQSWAPADAGIGLSAFVGVVTVDPAAPATLYVVTGDGVWRSADAGASWRLLPASPAAVSTAAVTISPAAHLTLFVGVANRVWKSTDGGSSWVELAGSLPSNAGVGSLAIDPLRPSQLYAATDVGLFHTTDGGASWLADSSGIGSRPVFNITVNPYREGTLWAGVTVGSAGQLGLFVSHDGGIAWQPVPAVTADAHCLAVSPAKGHPLYACGNGGLLESTDAGRDWRVLGGGLPANTPLSSVAVAAAAPGTVYTAALGFPPYSGPAVFRSTDGGARWQAAGAGIDAQRVTALAADSADAGTVYAGTATASVFRTAGGGAVWGNLNPGLNGISILALLADPLAPETVYATTNRAFFASHDRGQTWIRPGARFPAGSLLVADPQVSGTLYASNASGTLSRTTDGGATWTALAASPDQVAVMAVAASDPSTLYVFSRYLDGIATLSVLYISHDSGATFTTAPVEFAGVSAAAVDPSDSSTLYVSAGDTAEGGSGMVAKSTDGGQTFANLAGVPQLAPLLVDPANPSVVYGATLTAPADVLVSRDGGATWGELAPGLPGAPIQQLVPGPPGILYAGTQGASVYRLALDPTP